jgi:sulfite exporter TauE/SafE
MLSGLIVTAFLMGLSGAPHCATMCGVPCAAALRGNLPLTALVGRWLGYGLLGAIAAASAGLVSQWGRELAFIKPLWLMAQLAAVFFGLWVAISGRMPRRLDQLGLDLYHRLRSRWGRGQAEGVSPWLSQATPLLAGMAWAALPCGLLYGALMVAALAPNATGGFIVMSAFAIPSGVGVWLAPKLINRLTSRRGQDPVWSIRLAGLMFAGMAGWGLAHHVMAQWQAWCG